MNTTLEYSLLHELSNKPVHLHISYKCRIPFLNEILSHYQPLLTTLSFFTVVNLHNLIANKNFQGSMKNICFSILLGNFELLYMIIIN